MPTLGVFFIFVNNFGTCEIKEEYILCDFSFLIPCPNYYNKVTQSISEL